MTRGKTLFSHILLLLTLVPLGYVSVSANFFDPKLNDDENNADYLAKAESLIISEQGKRASGIPESWDNILPEPTRELFPLWILVLVLGLSFPAFPRQTYLYTRSRAPPTNTLFIPLITPGPTQKATFAFFSQTPQEAVLGVQLR